MNINKKFCTIMCSLQIAAFCFTSVYGASYSDITQSHWAYPAIESLCAKGYLKDFQSDKFSPDSYIDKFTTSKILSVVAGYTEGDANDYQGQKEIIAKYSSKFKKWNTASDPQIAYLLAKNILTEEDVSDFMLFSDDRTEKFRAISREEVAVLLVRLIGKTNEAEIMKNSNLFSDSSSITENRKGSINYLKSIGVLNGDNGACRPKNAVTRAEFCVLLNNITEKITPEKTSENTSTQATNNTSAAANTNTVTGAISGFYKNLNLVQIKSKGEITAYRLNSNVKITYNNADATVDKIAENLGVLATLNNSEIVELKLSDTIPEEVSQSQVAATETNQTTANTTTTTTTTTSTKEIELCKDGSASGVIRKIIMEQSSKNECVLAIENSDGETKYFNGTKYTIPVYSIKLGDEVKVTAEDGQIKTLKFNRKNNKNIMTGYVTDIDEESIEIKTLDEDSNEFYYDENVTECIDCTTGKKVDFGDIKKYTEVYILYEDTTSRTIDVIFVLDNL